CRRTWALHPLSKFRWRFRTFPWRPPIFSHFGRVLPRTCEDESPSLKGQFLYNGPSLRLQGRVAEGRVRVREGRSIPASAGTILVDLRFCRSKDPFSFSCEDLSVLCTVTAPTPLLPRSGKLSRPCTRMCSNLAEKATWARSPRNLSASGSWLWCNAPRTAPVGDRIQRSGALRSSARRLTTPHRYRLSIRPRARHTGQRKVPTRRPPGQGRGPLC